MYGISQEMLQRMERRIKDKILKEMQQQQREEQSYKARRNQRIKTEQDFPLEQEHRLRETGNNRINYELQQQSQFLPLVENNHKNSYPQDQIQYSQQIQRIKQSDLNQSNIQIRKRNRRTLRSRVNPQEVNNKMYQQDDKAQLYLKQCEQIINNLKQLTNKNAKKEKDINQSINFNNERQLPSSNHSFRINVKRYDHSGIHSPIEGKLRGSPINTKNTRNTYQQEDELQPNIKEEPSKVHNIKLIPIALDKDEGNEQMNENEETEKRRRLDLKRKKDKQTKDVKNTNNKKHQINSQNDKQKSKNTKIDNSNQSDSQKQKKLHDAVIKYLKKVRDKGNTLEQKVQQQKGDTNTTNNGQKSKEPQIVANESNNQGNQSNPQNKQYPSLVAQQNANK